MRRRTLLACGVASSLLYAGIDVLAAVCYPEYHSFRSRFVSELMARGAPTKALVDPLFMLYDVLAVAFAVGVWRSAGANRPLRASAAALFAYGVAGLPGPWFFPMHLRGTSDVRGDLPHMALTAVLVLFIFAAVLSGAFALGGRFRLYSFATVVAMLALGALLGTETADFAAGRPTPWIGLTERLLIGAFMLWVAVLAVSLRRIERPEVKRPRAGERP